MKKLLLISLLLYSCRVKLYYSNNTSPASIESRYKMIHKHSKMMQRKMNRARKAVNKKL
jgi:hypothetical protein